jgi:hypothetical protein
MKLVKVEHYRCGEIDGTSWLVAPDGKDGDAISDDIAAAEDEHMRVCKDVPGDRPPMPVYHLTGGGCRWPKTMTIAEIEAENDRRVKAQGEWEEAVRKRNGTFESLMRAKGYRELWELGDGEVDANTVDWGHNHGSRLAYGNSPKAYKPDSLEDDDDEL